ncbi:MAG: BatD family protein [Gammaproteobacteria bacterium]|nr:BatD family protein [Gammaproteobacteria bacterium]
MKYLSLFVLLLISSQALAAANITARLSHNPVSIDESFHLIFEADSNVDDDPDFSVLSKDFEILSSSQSTNMRSINGSWSLKKSWDLVLISRRAGVFTIPPVPFGADSSPAIRISVKSSTSNNTQGSSGKDAFFLEVSTDRKSARVQSEIIYTVRFLTSIPINRPTLSEPETSDPDAIVEKLGQVANYQKMINGVSYNVSELRFAVYPQHSGTLTFKPVLFEGRVTDRRRSSSLFDQFMQSGTLKRLRSKSVSVRIKPRPANVPADAWLPAEKVTIDEEWSEEVTQLRAGEPVTRTLTIKATGTTGEQLNDPEFIDVSGIKQYPDKAVVENLRKRDGITGSRQIKVAMIPTRAGRYVIPEISIPWWNTRTGKQQYARLPETVIEASGIATTAPLQPSADTLQADSQASDQPVEQTATPISADRTVIEPGFWPWVSLALAFGWLTTTLLQFRSRRSHAAVRKPAPLPSILPLARSVEKACNGGDADDTKDALLKWARVRWPAQTITSLADIADLSPPALRNQILALNTALYSRQVSTWEPKALLAAFHAFLATRQKTEKTPDSVLQPLYKT